MAFPIVNGVEVLIPPPEGYEVDFDNPTIDHSTVRATIWLFALEYALSLVFFGQRVYTNAVLVRQFRLDDYLFVAAFVLGTISQVMVLFMYVDGMLGAHAFEMSLDKHNYFTLILTTSTLIYIPTTILAKVILCFFYYRLSPATWYRYSVWITGIICAGSLIAIWFAVLFSCNPVSASWDARIAVGAKCIDRPPIYVTQAAFGSVTDFMLLVLPIPTLTGLQIDTRKKLGLIGLFSIGSITLVTSIVRLVLLLPAVRSPDQPWDLSTGCVWVIVEANLLIMCCSLPTLRLFLSRVAPSIFRDAGSKGRSDGYSNKNKNKGASSSFNIRTFGAGDGKRKFDTLVELEHDVHFTRSDDGEDRLRPADGASSSNAHAYGGRDRRPSSEGGNATETGSEEGIVQTRTTTVSYMSR